MPKQVFNKIMVQFHTVLMDDNGDIMEELSTEPMTCRNLETFTELLEQAKADIANFNAQQPNRRQRRAKS